MSAKLVFAIESKFTTGRGDKEDPIRQVTQYSDLQGNLLFEKDPLKKSEPMEETNPARLLEVMKRPLLVQGMLGRREDGVIILIDDELTPKGETITLWHEVIHLLMSASDGEHDEEEVERYAQRLAAQYPEIRKWVGLEQEGGQS